MDNFCGSPFWDWNLTWYTDTPDFTPCFERTVLSAIPCLFLWAFSILDFYSSHSSNSREIPWSPLNTAKIAVTTALVILELGELVFSAVILPDGYTAYPVDIYVPLARASTLILSLGLLLYSKGKGVRSSGVQFLFWLFLAVTQAIRFRTVILQSANYGDHSYQISVLDPMIFIMEVIYFPLVLGQLILHCWADAAPTYKGDFGVPSESNGNPEQSASFLSKIVFEWYTPLAWTGYKKPLEYSDLWDLGKDITSETVVPRFDRYWPKNLNAGRDKSLYMLEEEDKVGKQSEGLQDKKKVEGSIFLTSIKAFGAEYALAFVIKIMPDLMVLVSPLILNLLIEFVESPDEPTWKGILYAVLLFANALVSALLNTNGIHLCYKIGVRMRTSFISAIYRKSLLLSNSARRGRSTGEVVNHMAVDVGHISEFTQTLNLLVSSPLTIGIALYLLWNILGVSSLAGVAVMVLILPLNTLVMGRMQKMQKELMGHKDKRTKLMAEILNGIKCVKLYAWEGSFEQQVMKIREKELRMIKLIAYLHAAINFIWTCAPFMVALCTFGTYILVDSSHVLDAQTAFVSLSLFNVMSQPFTFLPFIISNYIRASVAVKRLNSYLNAEEIDTDAVSHDPNEPNPVIMENASFSWSEDSGREGGDTLQNINLQVKDGELVAIVGVVGSGKSSLLSALLNELVKTGGRVNIRGEVALVAQQAWIQNATLRDNVLFGSDYDPVKYNKIIEACALLPDLEMLPAGDQTEIGEKGINLSGGQKQRVALARAVYSNADVFLLDDPLSAVDAHVGKHIFDKVLGPSGLLRKKTRLLVTHGIVYLPFMDNIVVMTNGRVSETGSYKTLQKENGAFAEFLKQHATEEDSRKRKKSRIASESDSESGVGGTIKRSSSNASMTGNVKNGGNLEKENNKLIEKERAETDSVKSSVYLDYFRAAGCTLALFSLLMQMVFQGFSVGTNLWLAEWTSNAVVPNGSTVDNGTEDNSSNNNNQNGFYLSIYGTLGVLQGIAFLIASVIMTLATLRSANVLHFGMLERILRAPLQFFDITPIGRILNRFSKDVDSVDTTLPLFLRHLINSIFNVIAVLVVISYSTPAFTLIILPVGLLYYFIQRFYVASSRQLKRLESVTKSPIYSHFGETLSGVSTIRAFGQKERFIQESERRQDHNMMSYYWSLAANRWMQIRLDTVGNSVVFFAALFVVLGRDTLNAGMVGLSISYSLQITMSLLMLVRFTSDVETNIVAVERMKEYSQCAQEAPWTMSHKRPALEWPQSGGIVFEGFQTRYRPGLELVLRNVTCEIRAGEKVGIVGRTGAGKSSVTLGIFRIVEAAGGKILVDGEDISGFGVHDVRGRITIIPQEPMLFSGSLKMNLDPFEEKRDEELWRALELAHLKDFVKGLPGGLHYEIVEVGENLSVGQKQLVCLARALLRKTKILVLDEATSAVDLDTEELILKTIRSEFQDSTVITIAHRLNTIMDSDRVIVLEKGEIMEFDTPKNLLKNSKSVFYGMANEAGTSKTFARGISHQESIEESDGSSRPGVGI